MKEAYTVDQTFENTDFSGLLKGEYENCISEIVILNTQIFQASLSQTANFQGAT